MKFLDSFSVETKLNSLSKRIASLTSGNNAFKSYVDQKITGENLKYNLSLIISKIILNLQYVDRSKDNFMQVIKKYNEANQTSLAYKDFEESHLIRTRMDDIILPSVVRYYFWNINDEKRDGKEIEIPKKNYDLISCLKIYFENYFNNVSLTIDEKKLKGIIEGNSNKKLTIHYFIEKGLLQKKDSDLFSWKNTELLRHLRNEVASTLWILLNENDSNCGEKYFKLLTMTEIFPDRLDYFLTGTSGSELKKLAISILQNEPDFEKSENEFTKIWLDSAAYRQKKIGQEIPKVGFNYDSITRFIESINVIGRHFQEINDHQSIRSYTNLLFQIIIDFDTHPKPYDNILKLLSCIEKPALIWEIYSKIARTFPKLIPYLLTYEELAPLAFKLIDDIELNTDLLESNQNHDDINKAIWDTKNSLWLEMFDMILEHYTGLYSIDQKQALIIAEILKDCANKFFTNYIPGTNGKTKHSIYRERYEKALEKLSAKRILTFHTYPKPLVSPRVLFYIIPNITDFFIAELQETIQKTHPYLQLKSGVFDLCIEFVRLMNNRVSEIEIKAEQITALHISSRDLIKALNSHLTWFYTAKQIDYQDFDNITTIQKTAKRQDNEFGFEIIDWGYLYLQFEKQDLFDLLKDNFENAIAFDHKKKYYEDENRAEKVKIRIFLTSLTLAYLTINSKSNQFELDGLPVSNTIKKLKAWINKYFLFYSKNDIVNDRIDVLDDTFTFPKYNQYQHDLHDLLHQSLNYFEANEREDFITHLYQNSIELGKMLSAMNIIESNKTRVIISGFINNIEIDHFLDTRWTVTEYENTLIEAINSDKHWNLAKPIIEKIKVHFEKKKHRPTETEKFLFRINLLLAFKEKDFGKLSKLEVPKNQFVIHPVDKKLQLEKKYYLALFKLYNDNDYDKSAAMFRGLLSEEPKNMTYAYHLYHAQTLNAIK